MSEVTVNMTEDELKEKYEDRLEQAMSGPMHHLVAKTFKVLSGKKVYHSQRFESARNVRWIKCSLKASEGLLYPLDKVCCCPPSLPSFLSISLVSSPPSCPARQARQNDTHISLCPPFLNI